MACKGAFDQVVAQYFTAPDRSLGLRAFAIPGFTHNSCLESNDFSSQSARARSGQRFLEHCRLESVTIINAREYAICLLKIKTYILMKINNYHDTEWKCNFYNGVYMSIRIRSDVVSMKGIDAAKFTSETNKGIGKLKAIKAFFRGISVARDVVQTFTENHSSKLAETLEDGLVELDKRLVAKHNEALRESRVAENMDEIVENGRSDMEVYDLIRKVYTEVGQEEELAEFSDLSSDEVFYALVDSGLFSDRELRAIDRRGTDLEGSPYW